MLEARPRHQGVVWLLGVCSIDFLLLPFVLSQFRTPGLWKKTQRMNRKTKMTMKQWGGLKWRCLICIFDSLFYLPVLVITHRFLCTLCSACHSYPEHPVFGRPPEIFILITSLRLRGLTSSPAMTSWWIACPFSNCTQQTAKKPEISIDQW